jgi:hypothetical protein
MQIPTGPPITLIIIYQYCYLQHESNHAVFHVIFERCTDNLTDIALKFLLNILFVSHQVTRTTIATLAPAAKIDLNLNQRNRLKDLIAKSAAQKEIAEASLQSILERGFSMSTSSTKRTA